MNALLLSTAMALVPAAQAPPAPAEAAPAPTHQVLPGESLSWIASCELGDGDRWGELLELNAHRIEDPDLIQAGWQLVLPEGASGDCPTETPAVAAAAAAAAVPVEAESSAASGASGASEAPAAQARRRRAASPSGSSSAGGALAGIRSCESGGDYGAVSGSGQYRGAYQFDQQTWESVGGSGDPAAASPAEQDRRAAALYQEQGSSPWPSCG